ncbi:MAG: hypothetical protein ACRDHE_03855, partial [Ktedonobacterales bacterium]
MIYVFGVSLFFVSALLTACASGASSSAHKAQTRLDNEIVNARTNLHVPEGLLQPIETREKTIAAGAANGSDKALQAASSSYGQLYNQVVTIEHMTPDQARAQAQADLKAFTSALQQAQQAGYVEATQYQARLQQAQQELTYATTATDYFLASNYAEAQTSAIQMIDPVYKQLQTFEKLVTSQNAALGIVAQTPRPLECAIGDTGSYFWQNSTVMVTPPQTPQAPTYEYQQWPAQDLI